MRRRSGVLVRHLLLAALLAAPPAARLALDRARAAPDRPAAAPVEVLKAELATAMEDLRRVRADLEARGLDRLDPRWQVILADALPIDDPSPGRGVLWAVVRGRLETAEATAALAGGVLAGRVRRVYRSLSIAKVQSLLDPAFRVRFRLGAAPATPEDGPAAEASGMLCGTSRMVEGSAVLEVRHLSATAELKPGSPVFTEGGDGVYPPGILIGYLAETGDEPPGRSGPLLVHSALKTEGAVDLALVADTTRPRLEEARLSEAALERAEAPASRSRRQGGP